MQKKVILLFGGTSEERMVSVASAQNLAGQFGFYELIFQDKTEALYHVTPAELFAHQNVFTQEFQTQTKAFASNLSEAVEYLKDKVVFMGLHGSQGENGEVQSLFEKNKIAFTGSGSQASRTAFEKDLAKEVIANTDNKQAEEIKFNIKNIDSLKPQFENFLAKHKKIVIKPTSSGSSFGLHIVENQAQLITACEQIKESDFQFYLMENFIKGRELTVTVTQIESDIVALPASEVILKEGRSFDYNGKYLGSGSIEVTPAVLTKQELESAQRLAIEAHLAFRCYGYSRTDMILAADGPYFLETNTLPGLSKPSFVPQQLLAADMPIKNFIEQQILLAEARYDID